MRKEIHLARFLVSVGHKATHKVRLAGGKGGHELHKRDKVDGGDSLATTALLLLLSLLLRCGCRLPRVIYFGLISIFANIHMSDDVTFPEENQKGTGRCALHDLDNGVVDGILVLVKPPSDVVGYNAGIMRNGKVSVFVGF